MSHIGLEDMSSPEANEIIDNCVKEIRGIVSDPSVEVKVFKISAYSADVNFIKHSNDKTYYVTVAGFSLTQLPGCCGVLVSHGSFVTNDWQGKGVGTVLLKCRRELAQLLEYGLLICTTSEASSPSMDHLLEKHGSKNLIDFINPKTYNEVKLWAYEIE